jgi:hypothetical protein
MKTTYAVFIPDKSQAQMVLLDFINKGFSFIWKEPNALVEVHAGAFNEARFEKLLNYHNIIAKEV